MPNPQRPITTRGCSWLTSVLLAASSVAAAPEAVLRGSVREAATGRLTACTVTLRDAQGRVVTESPGFSAGFRCPGRFLQRLPPGRTWLRVTRGPETRAVEWPLELEAGNETAVEVSLERVVDLRRRGWYAGDSHDHMIHGERTVPVDFGAIALAAQAEDLQYLSVAQTWALAEPTPENLAAACARHSTPESRLTWNLEAPKNYYRGDAGRCLGHCWTLAVRGRTSAGQDVIQDLLTASAGDYESAKPMHTNFESHHLIHAQGGAVFYTHPARWWMGPWGGEGGYPAVERMRVSNLAVELPLDTLIGPTFDGLDVITSAGEIAANQKAFALWALLLNHGYRLAATASSDACFDRPGGAVPGAARTYAWLGGRFSLPAVARAIAAGRTFVTTGPLLVATLDGRPPGAAFRADGRPRRLRLEAWAAGHDPAGLSGIEVWRNGVVFRRLPLEAQPRAHTVELPLAEQEDAWYCARVNGRDAERQRAISGAFYFERRPYQAPPSVRAQVRARVADAATGAPLDGQLVEMTCSGTLARPGRRHAFRGGQSQFAIPGTARLRAEVSGYEPLTLSPFLDYPALVETITRLDDTSLVDWKTFERVRELLADVPLTFALEKKRPPAGPPPRRRTE